MREVTLGMIQLEPKLGDVPYNRTHSIELIRHAAAKGAQIIVLPETSLTGWDAMEYSREAWYEMAEDLDGESVTQFRILAKELGVYLVVGMALRTNQPPVMENAMVFIDDEGNLGEVYDKNYLFGPEKEYFTAHDRFPVYDTRYGKVGLLCCYDANFPETSRLLTLKGAELILHCASFWPGEAPLYVWPEQSHQSPRHCGCRGRHGGGRSIGVHHRPGSGLCLAQGNAVSR